MANLKVNVAGVEFPNPVIVGSASPSMDWIGVKKGIEGGSGGVIVKSLFGEKGKLGRNFPRPRFKLYDYKTYPGYPQSLPHAFTLNSLEECSHFGYQEYMEDVNRAKDAVGDKGIVMASLSGVTLDEWQEMVGLVNETNADWVELNVSCPFAADMGVKMGAGAVDMTADVVRTCANLLKKPFSVKVSPQTVDQSSVALACQEAGAQCINLSARFSGFDLDIDQARPVGPGAQGGWGGPYFIGYGLKTAQVERAPEGVYAKVDYDKCTKCGVCKRSCFYDAITLTKCGAVIDQHKCDGCGMCMEVCPANAVSMTSPQKRAN